MSRPEGSKARLAHGAAARTEAERDSRQAQILKEKAVYFLHTLRDPEAALEMLNQAIDLMPRAPALLEDRGLLYRKLGRWSEAIADYQLARALEEREANEAKAAALRRGGSVKGSKSGAPSGSRRGSGGSSSSNGPAAAPAPAPAPIPEESSSFGPSRIENRLMAAAEEDDGLGGLTEEEAAIAAAGEVGDVVGELGLAVQDESAEMRALLASPRAADDEEYGPSGSKLVQANEGAMLASGMSALSEHQRLGMLKAIETPPETRTLEQSVLLSSCLRSVPVLANLPEESRLKLCACATYQTAEMEEVLQRGSDRVGPELNVPQEEGTPEWGLHIILFGEVRVTKRMSASGATNTSVLKPGDHFGGIDLLHKALRSSTIRANEKCGFLLVEADEFRKILRRNQLEEAAERAIFVASVPMFHRLPWERLLRLVSLLQPQSFTHGETIAKQGETPQGLYIVYEGRCTVQRELTINETSHTLLNSRPPSSSAGGGRPPSSQGGRPPSSHGGSRPSTAQGGRPGTAGSVRPSTAGSGGTGGTGEGGSRYGRGVGVIRKMHLETLMPRDTYGGDAILHGLLRSQTSLVAETDATVLFMPRTDFSPAHLTEEALRMLKLNAKLYRPNDELLLQRHYQELEWDKAKRLYVKEVIKEAKQKYQLKVMLARNPATMRRSID